MVIKKFLPSYQSYENTWICAKVSKILVCHILLRYAHIFVSH